VRARGRRSVGLLAASAAAVLLAAGCGGGSSSKSEALSHAELTRRANTACAQASKRVRALKAPAALAGLEDYADAVQSIGKDLADDLDGLTPGTEDRVKLEAYRAALRQANDDAGQLAVAAAKGDRTAVRSSSDRLSESNLGVLAARAGLAQCATAVSLTST
jgi:hypothetical protein